MSSGGAAEPNLSLLNCFLISCWKVIVARFCGRGNQANKLPCSTAAVSLVCLCWPPRHPAAFPVFSVATQLGFVPKLWKGVAAAQTALVLALQGRHFGKTGCPRAHSVRQGCCASPAEKEECASAWPAFGCWEEGSSLLPGREQAQQEPCKLLPALPHLHLRDLSRDEQCFNITVGKKAAH